MSGKVAEIAELPQALQQYFAWIFTSLHEKHYGTGLDIAYEDKDSGKLMLTPYSLQKTQNGLELSLSIRFPISVTTEMIIEQVKQQLPPHSTLQMNRELPSHLFDKQHPIVKALSQVYQEITGLDGTPVTTTGATYARKMPNIFAFGPSFPGQKGIAHNSDEYMDVADLEQNFYIYLNAIQYLIQ
jgi:Acetylornithine deacetylase/Succinyl-diaminopimelate desuccinylase and related deacylases